MEESVLSAHKEHSNQVNDISLNRNIIEKKIIDMKRCSCSLTVHVQMVENPDVTDNTPFTLKQISTGLLSGN